MTGLSPILRAFRFRLVGDQGNVKWYEVIDRNNNHFTIGTDASSLVQAERTISSCSFINGYNEDKNNALSPSFGV